eukprot:jgi/Botrbrau1/58/Bobra.0022s0052.1
MVLRSATCASDTGEVHEGGTYCCLTSRVLRQAGPCLLKGSPSCSASASYRVFQCYISDIWNEVDECTGQLFSKLWLLVISSVECHPEGQSWLSRRTTNDPLCVRERGY